VVDETNYTESLKQFTKSMGKSATETVKKLLFNLLNPQKSSETITGDVIGQINRLEQTKPNELGITADELKQLESLKEEGFDISFLNNLLPALDSNNNKANTIVNITHTKMISNNPPIDLKQDQQMTSTISNTNIVRDGLNNHLMNETSSINQQAIEKNYDLLTNLSSSQFSQSQMSTVQANAATLTENLSFLAAQVPPNTLISQHGIQETKNTFGLMQKH